MEARYCEHSGSGEIFHIAEPKVLKTGLSAPSPSKKGGSELERTVS